MELHKCMLKSCYVKSAWKRDVIATASDNKVSNTMFATNAE